MLFKKELLICCILSSIYLFTACSQTSYTDYLEPSTNPPGGLEVKEVPMFVSIGFDDNSYNDGLEWILDITKHMSNPEGSGNLATYDGEEISLTFFNTGIYSDIASKMWKIVYDSGHEVGNHSYSHPHSGRILWDDTPTGYEILLTKNQWLNQIVKTDNVLNDIGIKSSSIKGFRIPFLEVTNQVMSQIYKSNFLYDCSIEEGFNPGTTAKNLIWPYTLDNGSPGSNYLTSMIAQREAVSSYPGLWELPVYSLVIPSDDLSEKYDFKPGLRERVRSEKPYVARSAWKITGFDYNILYTDSGKDFLSPRDYLAILKYNLDQRIDGNRAPFMLGAHISIYNSNERRAVITEFLNYALSKSYVRIVSFNKILDWIKSPESL